MSASVVVLVAPKTMCHGGGTLACDRRLGRDRCSGAVGCDEVDDRYRVLDVLREVEPADVGLQLGVARHGIELRPRID